MTCLEVFTNGPIGEWARAAALMSGQGSRWSSSHGSVSEYTVEICRVTTIESGLKSLAIDTLILVGRTYEDWNENGEWYARERLRTSRCAKVITVE